MAAITLSQAQAQLDGWLNASIAISSGQSHSFNGRTLTLANLADVNAQITFWERRVNQLTAVADGVRNVGQGALADFGGGAYHTAAATKNPDTTKK